MYENFEITMLQRGLLEKLIKRQKPIEKEVIWAIMGWNAKTLKNDSLPAVFRVSQEGRGDFEKVFPKSLCDHLFCNPLQIKLEP